MLPKNLFIIAACNPHRGNSVSTIQKPSGNEMNEKWFKEHYLVRPLHPSFKHLIWDFGFLESHEEKLYIEAKLMQLKESLSPSERSTLSEKIARSQNCLREFTHEFLIESGVGDEKSAEASSSVVSQRDIQRVLKLYVWLKESFQKLQKYGFHENCPQCNWHISVRALYTSLAMVYYFRLNEKYRKKFAKIFNDNPTAVTINGCNGSSGTKEGIHISFSKALEDELQWLIENVELPPGVANIKALRENLYLIITCCMVKIPLIITGPPGCSKTLSFKIAVANLMGEMSPKSVFRNKIMKCLEPHTYQCSKHSVTDEIDTLFEKATIRQRQIDENGLPSSVVVFMDKASLPNENLQILNVLHHHLDNCKVSFVALSNVTLDAAKSNRAICLFQTNTSHEDLQQLATTMLRFQSLHSTTPDTIKEQIGRLTEVYLQKMKLKEFNSIFGLRDIMHFFSYIRKRLHTDVPAIPPEMLVQSLQRNFSGLPNFQQLAIDFLSQVHKLYSLV